MNGQATNEQGQPVEPVVQAPPPAPVPEVTRAEFDEMRGQISGIEQAVTNLVAGLQAERDKVSRDAFTAEFEYEFGGMPDVAESCWRAWEESDRSGDRREFVSRMIAQMDNQMVRYLAAKGMEVVMKKAESEMGSTGEMGVADESEGDADGAAALEASEEGIGAHGEIGGAETETGGVALPDSTDEGGSPGEPSERDKINRLLSQND